MNFNPPLSSTQNPNPQNQTQSSGLRLVRGQPSAWGQPGPGASSRRGLPPLSTSNESSTTESGRAKNTPSPSHFTSSFSSVLNSTTQRDGARANSSFSNSFPPLQTGSQQSQPGSLLLSPRSRAITPSSNPNSASSAAASTTASQVGGPSSSGGGGTANRPSTFSPPPSSQPLTSPTTTSLDRISQAGSTSANSSAGSTSVSRIVDTQLFLLLGSITEKEGKAKWESQAQQIRSVLESNNMENFPKYFRRLLTGNAPQIFPGINRNVENPANYPLLVESIEKITSDPKQAARIAAALDTNEGEVFRDFDLNTFMKHFKLSAITKTLLLSAITRVSRPDLRSKAASLLRSLEDDLSAVLANSSNDLTNTSPILLATCTLRFLHDSPSTSITAPDYQKARYCLELRYSKQGIDPPPPIQSTYAIMDLDQTEQGLYTDVVKAGPTITSSLEDAKAFLSEHSDWSLDEGQVCAVILYMTLNPDWETFNVSNFIAAVQESSPGPLDWKDVIRGFDRDSVLFTKAQFLTLYEALLPIAKAKPDFDIQILWRGPYKSTFTHLSILSAFLACSPLEIDVSSIPNFRPVYDPSESLDGPEGIAEVVETALRDPMLSSDAITALLEICIPTEGDVSDDHLYQLQQVIGEKVGLFLCSVSCIESSSPARDLVLRRLIGTRYLNRKPVDSLYVLHTVWKHDKTAVAHALMDDHLQDPLNLVAMLDLALELGWLDELLTMSTGFGFDLATLAHRQGLIDFSRWAEGKMTTDKNGFISALAKFAVIKAQDELRISRDEQPHPRTVSLAMRTAYDMLTILDKNMDNVAEVKTLQRTFLQAYPRLILLSEGVTDNIDVDCKESNTMPRSADVEMQELYKRLYGNEIDVGKVIDYLQDCKHSDDLARRDLFACMIHGLFDEYSCFHEYPLEPLSKTAVLFGGIIQFAVVSDLTLRVAKDMVLDALNDYSPEESMFKFGLQASKTFSSRFQETEWIGYCKALVQNPKVHSTPLYGAAAEALTQHGVSLHGPEASSNVDTGGLAVGKGVEVDGTDENNSVPIFRSIQPGPDTQYEEPTEEVKESVIFFFNNVSQQNLSTKFDSFRDTLEQDHFAWFADFLVEERAKKEPNYQPLYLQLLRLLDDKILWHDVLRSTYAVIARLFNSETTMHSASERKNLKSLATWLGALTIAQDKPVKRKNIAFTDLLIEGFQFERLLLVIPFVCNFLTQGKDSNVFRPPNPWVMEILALLIEFYHDANITTNQKFDIEVLCEELSVKIQSIEPSNLLNERTYAMIDQPSALLPDGIRTFEGISLANINGTVQNPRFEPEAMQLDLSELAQVLRFPPPSGSAASQVRLREIVAQAVEHAILEIIGSVVERSVTIATIAAAQLIRKDFACEDDDNKIRQAAQRTVRQLASSLALVTAKDPLRTSMTNFIRKVQAESPAEQPFPEGTILMCITDNLDVACELIESRAADQAVPEIEAAIERELSERAQWRRDHPGEPYTGPTYNRYGTLLREPYKQTTNGLTPEQMDIYQNFGRQSRGPPTHAQTSSADSGRQLPDVLQDGFSAQPPPADPMGLNNSQGIPYPYRANHYSSGSGQVRTSATLPTSMTPVQVNGYRDPADVEAHNKELLTRLTRVHLETNGRQAESLIRDPPDRLIRNIEENCLSTDDSVAMVCAEQICQFLSEDPQLGRPLAGHLAQILSFLDRTYPNIAKEVAVWAHSQTSIKMLNTDVTVELLKHGIFQFSKVDESLAELIENHEPFAAEALSTILEELWQSSSLASYRADFARSLGALAQWRLAEQNDSNLTREVWDKVNAVEPAEAVTDTPNESALIRKHQVNYVFSEWVRLCSDNSRNPNGSMFSAFVVQAHLKKLLETPEDVTFFLRLCIDASVAGFEVGAHEDPRSFRVGGDASDAFTQIDWLAHMMVLLVISHSEHNGTTAKTKANYLDSMLSMTILIMNHHQVTRQEQMNQRVFFRLFSSILCYWYELAQETPLQHEDTVIVFAENFLRMQPQIFPGFACAWLGLVSHRLFMPEIFKIAGGVGNKIFAKIVEAALVFVGKITKAERPAKAVLDFYQAVLRVLLVLHHDYPTFLAENHFRFCNAIPEQGIQILNIILSASPESRGQELPNPFVHGLKIDRLEQIQESPRMTNEHLALLSATNIQELLDSAMKNYSFGHETVQRIIDATSSSSAQALNVDRKLIHSIVLYIGETAVTTASQRGSSAFLTESPQAILLEKLFKDMKPFVRGHLINSMVNQLRWHNAHTYYFVYALLHLFNLDTPDQAMWDAKQQILTVLLERIHTVLPHPWGLIVILVELLKNPRYSFWQLPFVKDSPQIQALCDDLLKQGEDREQRWSDHTYNPRM